MCLLTHWKSSFPLPSKPYKQKCIKKNIISNLMGDIYWIWILRYWLKYVRYCFFVLWFLGLDSEGIYRVSGFSDDIEALKDSFDNGIFKETLLVYATVQLETIGWLTHSKTMCSLSSLFLPLHLHRWAFYCKNTCHEHFKHGIALWHQPQLSCCLIFPAFLLWHKVSQDSGNLHWKDYSWVS